MFILLAAAFQLGAKQVEAEDALIEVSEVSWTNGIEEHQPLEQYVGETYNRPLYLWMKIKGKTEALEKLKEHKRLPIRHKWFHLMGGTQYWEENPVLKDEIDLSVEVEDKIDQLHLELMNRSFFDWRIWSMKKNIKAGTWIVRMVYADNKPVKCGTKDCEWSIVVR